MTAISIMLDSGAYSSWKRGEHIDLTSYIAFVKRNEHLLASYANLDVIPGRWVRSIGARMPPSRQQLAPM